MKITLGFDLEFGQHQMGRLDTLITEEIVANGFEKGVARITGPADLLLMTMEYEERLVSDFQTAFLEFEKKIKKKVDDYILSKTPRHEIVVPVNFSRLVIGDWQQIVFFTLNELKDIQIEIEFFPSESILGLESIETTSELQTFDITDIIQRTLMNSHKENITLITPSSTAILYSLRPERYKEFSDFLKKVAPYERAYKHKHSWQGSSVAHSHIRSAFIGQAITFATHKGELDLPEHERLFLTELDLIPRRRDIYFEIWKS